MGSGSNYRGQVAAVESGLVQVKAENGVTTPWLRPLISVPAVGEFGLVVLLPGNRSGFFIKEV